MKHNLKIGKHGEKVAVKFLLDEGYSVLEKNYKNKIGEIDIIASKDNILAFVEVKTRTNNNYGSPYEAVNYKKQRKIISTAMIYIQFNNIRNTQFRFDILEVYYGESLKINHIKNAFT